MHWTVEYLCTIWQPISLSEIGCRWARPLYVHCVNILLDDSTGQELARLNLKVKKISLSSGAHGVMGQTSRTKYGEDGKPVRVPYLIRAHESRTYTGIAHE